MARSDKLRYSVFYTDTNNKEHYWQSFRTVSSANTDMESLASEAFVLRVWVRDEQTGEILKSMRGDGTPGDPTYRYLAENTTGITISAADFDRLQPKDRVFIKTSGGFSAGEREFEVGRKSYSKKYKVESKRLYPVGKDGKPIKRGIAKWTLYKRDDGRVSLAHGDMGTVIHEFRRANPDPDPYRRGPRVHVHHTYRGDETYAKAVKAARRLAKKLKKTVYVDARDNEWIVWSYGKPSDPSAATFFGSRYHETAVEPPRSSNPEPVTESELTKRLKF